IFEKPTKSWAATRGVWCARRASCRNIIARSLNCWSKEVLHRHGGRFASTRSPVSPSLFATPSSDDKDRPHHRRRNLGPVGSRSAGEREFQGACPCKDPTRRWPLAVLFR